jgi:hypothetical protein
MKRYFFRNLFLITLFMLICFSTIAQVRQQVSTDYDRNSLTILLLDAQEKYTGQLRPLMDSLKVPEKFFDNTLVNKSVPVRVDRTAIAANDSYRMLVPLPVIESALSNANIPQMLLSRWFDRQEDGSFGVKTLAERGVYNATDNDLLVATASKRGAAGLMDMGMGLVDNSYIILLDFAELLSMAEIYERDSISANERTMNGFKAKMNAYVFKLDFSEPVAANFFQNLWISGNSDNKEEKRILFENTRFPLIHINTFTEEVVASQLNPGQKYAPDIQRTSQQLLKSLMETGFNQSLLKLENTNEAFRVKGMVFDVNPVAVKIGRKEGLKFDQRYYVYENRQDRRGNVYSKRKGVIRSMSIANNLGLADGASDPSLFYQVAGGKIDNMGMFVEQKNASGLNLFAGYTEGGLSGGTARLELLFSPLLYEAFSRSGAAKGMTGWKIYVEGAYGTQEFMYEDLAEFSFYRGSVGLSKEIYLTRNIFIDPFLGYGIEGATPPESDGEKFESQFIEFGSRLGLNIAHNVQLMPAVNLYSIIKSEYLESKDAEPVSITYIDQFEGRAGTGLSVGLRFMF